MHPHSKYSGSPALSEYSKINRTTATYSKPNQFTLALVLLLLLDGSECLCALVIFKVVNFADMFTGTGAFLSSLRVILIAAA